MSYLADYQIYGLKPWGYHLTNVLLHSATTILLFLVLWQMTGELWPCAFVAAVFAIHPLHVESVAWVAERKGLLGGLFFVLSLGAYLQYVRRQSVLGRCLAYLAMLAFFALGLMSKPMLVTLPFVLLLLDYWPLGRMQASGWGGSCTATWGDSTTVAPTKALRSSHKGALTSSADSEPLWRLIAEKIPLLLLAVASCAIAPWAQGKAVIALEKMPLSARIGNALVSYVAYLGETFWPAQSGGVLSASVRDPADVETAGRAGAAARRHGGGAGPPPAESVSARRLALVSGDARAGDRSGADRLARNGRPLHVPAADRAVPRVDLDGAGSSSARGPRGNWACCAAAAVVLAALTACAMQQTTYWRDSEALWTRALECTPPNSVAHANLGAELARLNKFDRGDRAVSGSPENRSRVTPRAIPCSAMR